MPFNGSGVYTPPAADFPVVTNTVISSTHFNNTINDIASGLTNCLTKDGQTTPTANIKLGGFKLTGVGVATTSGDALSFAQAATVTTLTASTSVLTSLVSSVSGSLILNAPTGSAISLQINSAVLFSVDATNGLLPSADGTQRIGGPTNRIGSVLTTAIDSGSTSALSIRTNNGTQQMLVTHIANAVNAFYVQGNSTGNPVTIGADPASSDTNVGMTIFSKGTGTVEIRTNTNSLIAAQFLHVAGANRNITIAGSNGGNPTIGVTGGSLAITPSVVIAGASLQIGTNPATVTGSGFFIPNAAVISVRNAANSNDLTAWLMTTINGVSDVLSLGTSLNGVHLGARIKAGAFVAADISVGQWMLGHDSSGATTKLYYNDGGALRSVALA